MAAGFLTRRAAAATIRAAAAALPAHHAHRLLPAAALPRLAPKTPMPSVRGFSALAAIRPRAATALGAPSAGVRHSHDAAPTADQVRGLEERIQRVEVDFDARIVDIKVASTESFDKLRMELLRGSAEAQEKLERVVVDLCAKIQATNLDSYKGYLDGQARLNDRISNLSYSVNAEGRRSVTRSARSAEQNAANLVQVSQVSWRVVVTVVTGAASTAFAVCQLMQSNTTDGHTRVADTIVKERVEHMTVDLQASLEGSVQRAVDLAMARQATRMNQVGDEMISRIDDVLASLDDRVAKAVKVALSDKNKGGGK